MISYFKKFRGQQAALPPRPSARKVALAGAGAAVAISLLAALAAYSHQPLLLGSLGASCVFLFCLPEAPFSQPRNVIAGHLAGSLLGLVFLKTCGPHAWALGLALGTATALMFATRALHAPAGANPVIVFVTQPDWSFLLVPTLVGAVGIVLVALLFNNAVHPGRYPLYWLGHDAAPRPQVPSLSARTPRTDS